MRINKGWFEYHILFPPVFICCTGAPTPLYSNREIAKWNRLLLLTRLDRYKEWFGQRAEMFVQDRQQTRNSLHVYIIYCSTLETLFRR